MSQSQNGQNNRSQLQTHGIQAKSTQKVNVGTGVCHRGKRCIEPEATVFGQIKHNSQFNRFRLRGLKKVNVEFTPVAIAHNLRKLAKKVLLSWLLLKIMHFYSKNREKQNLSDIKSIILLTAMAA